MYSLVPLLRLLPKGLAELEGRLALGFGVGFALGRLVAGPAIVGLGDSFGVDGLNSAGLGALHSVHRASWR